jgi:hypothetical protein
VAIRGDRSNVRALVRRHGWQFPVGYDRDGALANLFRLAVCSQITFADRGGRVHGPALLGTPPLVQVRAGLLALTSGGRATGAGGGR